MRGKTAMAVAVRNPSGEIVLHRESLPAAIYNNRIIKLPFLRGLVVLWDSLVLGMNALLFSANIALEEDEEMSETEQEDNISEEKSPVFSGAVAWGTILISLAFGMGLFFVSPLLVIKAMERYWFMPHPVISNLIEGLIRLLLFIVYLLLVSLMPDIRRVFSYHGAEHKTINAYEAGVTLEPEHVDAYSTSHTRCGTGFLLWVMIISVVIFSLLGRPPLIMRLASRILLIPVIAGISYEALKWSSAHYDNVIVRALVKPSLVLQKLTTRAPDKKMLEVSITALKGVLAEEGSLT